MIKQNIKLFIPLFLLIALFIFMCILRTRMKSGYNVGSSSPNDKYKRCDKIYKTLTKIPLIRNDLANIRMKYYLIGDDKDYVIRYKAVITFTVTWLLTLILYLFLYRIYRRDFYMVVLMVFVSLYFKSILVDRVIGDDTKVLYQVLDFIKDIKHQFHMTGDVDSAIAESMLTAPRSMVVHGAKMRKAIQSEEELSRYNEDCPSKFLKLLVGPLYITYTYGDTIVREQSIFLRNMNYTSREIHTEISMRTKVRYLLNCLTTIAIMPVFLPNVVKSYFGGMFPEAKFFYESSLDLIARLVIVAVSLLCFFALRNMMQFNKETHKISTPSEHWEAKLLQFHPIALLVNIIKPKYNSAAYHREINLIADSGSSLTVEWLTLRRLLMMLLGFVFCVCAVFSINKLNANAALNGSLYSFSGINSKPIIIRGKRTNPDMFDKKLLEEMQKEGEGKVNITTANIVTILENKGIKDEAQRKEIAERLVAKVAYATSRRFRCHHLIFAVVFGLMFSSIPILHLYFLRYLRKKEMDSEIYQLYTIVLLLMYHDRASIEMLLEWFARFSDVFRDPIVRAINNLPSGYLYALNKLKDEVKFRPFQALVDDFIMADSMPIAKAFENLDTEREFNELDRKEALDKVIESKKVFGKFIGFTPVALLLVLYLVVPMMWAAFLEFEKIFFSINKM